MTPCRTTKPLWINARTRHLFFLLLLSLPPCPAVLPPLLAADRALLVGVGDYRSPHVTDLDGTGLDLTMMREVVRLLGFPAEGVQVLADAAATEAAVDQAIREWLVEGAGPEDRILFYFSGHGAQVADLSGDELDGRDEVLALHDTRMLQERGQTTLDGVLLDDRLQQLLSAMRSQQVILLVDACHSGTFHKGFQARKGDLFRELMPAGTQALQQALGGSRGSYRAEPTPAVWAARVETEVVR